MLSALAARRAIGPAASGMLKSPEFGAGPSSSSTPSSEDETSEVTRADYSVQLFSGAMEYDAEESQPFEFTYFQFVRNETYFELEPSNAQLLGLESLPGIVLVIRNPQVLSFVGSANLVVLRGQISIFGVDVPPSAQVHRVFSPKSSPVCNIEAHATKSASAVGYSHIPDAIRARLGPNGAIVVVQELRSGIEELGKIYRILRDVFYLDGPRGPLSGFYPISMESREIHPFLLPKSWKAAIRGVSHAPDGDELSPFIALVAGPKGVGKSTFCRILCNTLLQSYQTVAFLECDLGQSEFTPAGMVSLHLISRPAFGPSFTHPEIPYKAHYVGSPTPRSNPSHYLSCIATLMEVYRVELQHAGFSESHDIPCGRKHSNIPLVVNTHGWVKGFGAELARKIEETVEPTHIFDFNGVDRSPLKCRRDPSFSAEVLPLQYTLLPITPSPRLSKYTAADHRSMSLLSYFHATFHSSASDVSWPSPVPLFTMVPWEVSWKVAIDGIVLTGAGAEDVLLEDLPSALNCSVVGLIALDDNRPKSLGDHKTRLPFVQGSLPPSPTESRCLGLGIVRALSETRNIFHIISPIPVTSLSLCRVLVKGELTLPLWGMIDGRHEGDDAASIDFRKAPYLQWGPTTAVGAIKRRIRKNIIRRGQV